MNRNDGGLPFKGLAMIFGPFYPIVSGMLCMAILGVISCVVGIVVYSLMAYLTTAQIIDCTFLLNTFGFEGIGAFIVIGSFVIYMIMYYLDYLEIINFKAIKAEEEKKIDWDEVITVKIGKNKKKN